MAAATPLVKIDFVSDVVCPWCAVGLRSLEVAIEALHDTVRVDLHFQPFELNPTMPPQGQDIVEHLMEKYRISREQVDANAEALRERGAVLGFEFRPGSRQRTYNSFDAHRLLCWAELADKDLPLKHALLRAYFTEGWNISDKRTLATIAATAGLSEQDAKEVLDSDRHAREVRSREQHFARLGITAVPSVIMNDRNVVRGAQLPQTFENALQSAANVLVTK